MGFYKRNACYVTTTYPHPRQVQELVVCPLIVEALGHPVRGFPYVEPYNLKVGFHPGTGRI